MFTYILKQNIEYQGLAFPCGRIRKTEIKTEKLIIADDKESKRIIFEALKSAKLIAEWVTVEQIWLSPKTPLCKARINFTSKHSYWQSGIIGFWELKS